MTERSELIEAYLDELLAALRGSPRDIRLMLAETEQHLYEATEEGIARGLGAEQAARDAIDRFGPPTRVASAWNADGPELAVATGGSRRAVALARVRRRRGVIVAAGLLGAVAAIPVAWAARPMPLYTATALVEVSGIPDASTLAVGRTNNVDMANEVQYLTSLEVIDGAKRLLKIDTDPDVLARQVRATVPPGTTFMQIRFVARTRDKAIQGAEAFSQSYLTSRGAYVRGLVQARAEDLTKMLVNDQKKLAFYAAMAATLPSTNPEKVVTQSWVAIYREHIRDTKGQLASLAALDTSPVRIITPPSTPTESNPPLSPLAASIAGFVVGLLAAVLLAALVPARPTPTPPSLSPA